MPSHDAPSGVIVTGAPRSGTSATTRLVSLAGAHLCLPSDLVGGGPNNPTGHWESKTALSINNRLLDAGGYRWWCPPPLGASLDMPDAESAAGDFLAVHHGRPWLCKDPRFSFTLPFWQRTLHETVVSVVVVRRPDETVASLQRTWPLSTEHATALWARYVLAALTVGPASGPTVIVRFPEVLEAPAVLGEAVASFGVDLCSMDRDAIADFVRSPRGSGPAGGAVSSDVRELWHALARNDVVTDAADVTLPAEPASVESLLCELRDQMRAGRPIDVRPVFARPAAG